ncbi:MAG: hypothetical protein CSA09_04335 [Candidatus Contendobacter odensis]|uniref:Molecular chaperone HtpG n=1 Tax=Candidatus Contendibacter odensensis TaxID=1400860 RepID=A0A2G6PED0_9GAMM|nr:MAG: hypothetical protein CSA09_04335 [Candidatus Contendobacter odensis]
MPKMRTSFQGLVRLLAKSLYPEPDVFIRELLQNAHDSIQLRQTHTPEPAGDIRIDSHHDDRSLHFTDNGNGMDQRDIKNFLSVIGSTGTGSHARKLAARDVAVATIGQFGIGLLSAFVVAERIEVRTRKWGSARAWRWVNHGDEEYDLTALPENTQPFGTQVIVTLVPEKTLFLDGQQIRQQVRRHADFLPFPIRLNGFETINALHAPWHQTDWCNPALREHLLSAFFSQHYADPPLLVIPIDLSQPHTQGGLYIPARYSPSGQGGGTIDLYQARMCIRNNDGELLPTWAQFVRGVIDCSDLQPTAARDNVLRDTVYYTLRDTLGQSIVTALINLATCDRPRFQKICDWHHDAIKGMALRHTDFGAAVLDYLPFETNQGQLTLSDYFSRQPPMASRKPLYFFSHEADANQFYALCQAQKRLAINAGRTPDEHLLRYYAEQHSDEVELKPLDRLDDPAFYELLNQQEAATYAHLERAVERVLADIQVRVRTQTRRFQPDTLSVVLIAGQRVAAFDAMESALERPFLLDGLDELAGEVRDRLRRQPMTLFLNAAHPLIQRLGTLSEPDHPQYRPILTGLYHSALLNAQHRLTPAAARRFHADLQTLLGEYLALQLQHG